jgi:predicted HTH transcriptional regulator
MNTIADLLSHPEGRTLEFKRQHVSIRLAIFDDRLEVENPGGWPVGFSEDHFKAGISRARNPVMARVLHELSVIERWGSGYRRIREACEEDGYPLPSWHEVGPVLRVRLHPHPDVSVNVGVNERQQWFLDQIGNSMQVKPKDIVEKFGVTICTAERDIADLRDSELITFVGPPKTGHYVLRIDASEASEGEAIS